MAIELETAEMQLDAVGAEAVQQTLDALGIQAEAVNSTAGGDGPPASPPSSIAAADLSRIEALLERIAAAVERTPSATPGPTY